MRGFTWRNTSGNNDVVKILARPTLHVSRRFKMEFYAGHFNALSEVA